MEAAYRAYPVFFLFFLKSFFFLPNVSFRRGLVVYLCISKVAAETILLEVDSP